VLIFIKSFIPLPRMKKQPIFLSHLLPFHFDA